MKTFRLNEEQFQFETNFQNDQFIKMYKDYMVMQKKLNDPSIVMAERGREQIYEESLIYSQKKNDYDPVVQKYSSDLAEVDAIYQKCIQANIRFQFTKDDQFDLTLFKRVYSRGIQSSAFLRFNYRFPIIDFSAIADLADRYFEPVYAIESDEEQKDEMVEEAVVHLLEKRDLKRCLRKFKSLRDDLKPLDEKLV